LFRFRNEALGGSDSNGAPEGLKEHFEKQKLFTGWGNFAVNWDIPHATGCRRAEVGENCDCSREPVKRMMAVRRYESVWDQWDEKMRKEVPVLPGFKVEE
jgi:hypothetical protein